MKVLKFGGTSVGSVESILSLKNIVMNEAREQSVIVVVSALGGITDKLIETSRLALAGDERYREEFEAIVDRHHKMIDTIITDTKDREQLFSTVDSLLEQLRSIYFGVFLIHDLSKKTEDAIVAYGERLSSNIVATLIKGAKWFDSRTFIKTENKQESICLTRIQQTNWCVKRLRTCRAYPLCRALFQKTVTVGRQQTWEEAVRIILPL